MDGKNNSILADSNIIIYSAQLEYEVLARWLKNKNISISDVTRIEVLGYSNLMLEDKLYFEKFFSKCDTFPMDEEIVHKAISLKQQKKMSLGDAIIAATALAHKLPLVTVNTKDFNHIEMLELINPMLVWFLCATFITTRATEMDKNMAAPKTRKWWWSQPNSFFPDTPFLEYDLWVQAYSYKNFKFPWNFFYSFFVTLEQCIYSL